MQYAIHMTEIGYGRTKQQLQYLVKQIVEKDGQPNPFLGIYLARNGGSFLNSVTRIRGRGRGRGKGRGRNGRGLCHTQLESSSESSDSSSSSIVSSDYECSVCGEPGRNWIECESCEKWYHLHCVGIQANIDLKTLVWTCSDCQN